MKPLRFFPKLIVSVLTLIVGGLTPLAFAQAGTWTLLSGADGTIPDPWENDLVVDPVANAAFFGFGHFNANTNRLYRYTDTQGNFQPLNATFHRPPKRCGVTLTYDSNLGLIYGWGGEMHFLHWNQHYGTLDETATGLRPGTEVSQELWAFDALTEQWYNMRPTGLRPTMRTWPGRVGYDHTSTFAADYGLMLVLFHDYVSDGLWAYHGYSNQWIHFPGDPNYSRFSSRCGTDFPCTRSNSPIAYDLHSQKMVKVGGRKECYAIGYDEVEDPETWTWDIGTDSWSLLDLNPKLPVGLTGTNNSVTTMAASYDEANDLVVVVSLDGKFTSTLNIDSDAGWNVQQLSTGPTAGGIMGNHFKYDAANNRNLIYTGFDKSAGRFAKELWAYDAGPGVSGRPSAPTDLAAVTEIKAGVSQVTLSWAAPTSGIPPTRYDVYRAAWGTLPGPYQLLGNTDQLVFVDNTLQSGQRYSYVVRGLAGNEESNPSGAAYNYLPRPLGLAATVLSTQRVDLAWARMDEPDLVGYDIYRSEAGAPPMLDAQGRASGFDPSTLTQINLAGLANFSPSSFTKINRVPINAPRYIDTSVDLSDGIIRTYAVVGVNRLGESSGFSPLAHTIPDPVGGPWVDTATRTVSFLPPVNGGVTSYFVYSDGFGSFDIGNVPDLLFPTPITTTSFTYAPNLCAAISIAGVNVLGQVGFHSDIVPVYGTGGGYCPSDQYYGWDGRTVPTLPDPFWESIGQ